MAERTRRRAAASSRRSADDGGGGGLDRDYSGEEYREPGEGYNGPTPKKGLYPAKLVTINDHTSGEGNESVRWGFELTGGTSPDDNGDEASVEGFRDYQYTNDDTTLWREQQIAVALGLVKPNGKLKMSFANILKRAKPCTVRLIRERYIPEDGGDPEWRAKIAAVMTARDLGGAAKKSRRAKDDDEVEDVFEDDADAEDEDEPEEETPTRARRSSRRKAAAEPEPDEDEEDEEEEAEEDEDEEPYDADELAAELADLSLAALKKRARDEFGVKITRSMVADDIIEAILDTLEDEEEDEEEPPPPPKRTTRSRTAAKTGSRRRASKGSEEPPF